MDVSEKRENTKVHNVQTDAQRASGTRGGP